jgi:Domain of unknown function (DUF4292)
MKKIILLLLITISISSCKAKKVIRESHAKDEISSEKIIASHYLNKTDFKTIYIKSSVRFEDDKQTQNVSAEIRIKKNEVISVSIRFLGITMAKALITPNKVQYYEKIGGKFFEGNYQSLSQFLGTDLNFEKVQNLFIGQALDDLTKEKYINSIEDKLYKLENNQDSKSKKTFYFDSESFHVTKQLISQPEQSRSLQIVYPEFYKYPEMNLPISILIDALMEKGRTNIKIDYNSATFNEEINFPYSVPEGYEQIFIK